jgi:hypothetical protein
MPKELTFNIKQNSNIAALVKELKDLKAAVDDVNKSGAGAGTGGTRTPRSPRVIKDPTEKMLADAQKANLRTQVAALRIPGVYGRGGAEEYSGYRPTMGKPKGGTGALGFGLIAGAAAAGVMILVNVLKSMIKESQIISKFLGTFGKLMGTLIDLVLLPFLPILVYALIGLTTAVLAFGTWWNETITPILKQLGLGGQTPEEKKKAYEDYSKTPFGMLQIGIDKFLSSIPKLIDTYIVQPIKNGIAGWSKAITDFLAIDWGAWASNVWKGFTDWVAGVGKQWDILKAAWDTFWAGVTWDALAKWWSDVTQGFTDWMDGVGKQWDILTGMVADFFKPLTDIITTLTDLVNSFSWDPLIQRWKGVINGIIVLLNGFIKSINLPLSILPGNFKIPELPFLDTGGKIEKTGVAVVHKGETVTPAGQTGGTIMLNFYGYQDDKFVQKVKDVLRKEGSRYMQ